MRAKFNKFHRVSFNLTITSGEKFLQVKVMKCPSNSTRQGDIYTNPSLNLKVTWTQAGVLVINYASHLYYMYKCSMLADFQSISTRFQGFSPDTPVSSLIKTDSLSFSTPYSLTGL